MKHMSRNDALARLMDIAGSDWDLSVSIEQNLVGGAGEGSSDFDCPTPESSLSSSLSSVIRTGKAGTRSVHRCTFAQGGNSMQLKMTSCKLMQFRPILSKSL